MMRRWGFFGAGQDPHELVRQGVVSAAGKNIPLPGGSKLLELEFSGEAQFLICQKLTGVTILPSQGLPLDRVPVLAQILSMAGIVVDTNDRITNALRKLRDKYVGVQAYDISDPW